MMSVVNRQPYVSTLCAEDDKCHLTSHTIYTKKSNVSYEDAEMVTNESLWGTLSKFAMYFIIYFLSALR